MSQESKMNHDLDAGCARALGHEPQMRYCERAHEMAEWHEMQSLIEARMPPTAAPRIAAAIQCGTGMLRPCVPRGTTGLWRVVPAYSESHEAARELEDEIERRGLVAQYVHAIAADIKAQHGCVSSWHLLRATPEQRARAFVEAATLTATLRV